MIETFEILKDKMKFIKDSSIRIFSYLYDLI